MVCSKQLIFLAACLLVMASGAMGAIVIPSGSTIEFITNDPPTCTADANFITISMENGAAKYVFANGLDIQAGANVTVTGTNPLYIVAATGDITIDADIDLNGRYMLITDQTTGGLGGPAGGYQAMTKRNGTPVVDSGPGAGGFGSNIADPANTALMRAAGGAGYGGAGGMNSANAYAISQSLPVPTNGVGGVSYGDEHVYILYGGSGGGAGKDFSGDGGGGGAIALKATAGNITIGGNITCDGGPGMVLATDVYPGKQARYGGGGGAGGSIRIDAGSGTVTINGSLSAKGGHGSNAFIEPRPWTPDPGGDNTGHCAGGGGGGRIAVYSSTGTHLGSGTISVIGGAGGQYLSPLLPGEFTWDGDAGGDGTFAQYAGPLAPQAYDPTPVESATNITIFTDLKWHNGGGTSQDVYFETSAGNFGLIKSGSGTLEQVTAAELQAAMGGPLADLTTYQWKVVTNGNTAAAAVWPFTTNNAAAHAPVPADNAYESPYGASVTVSWTSDSSLSATGADVYFGTSAAAVAARTATKYTATTAPYTSEVVSAPDRGVRYYWLVDQKYGALIKNGTVWTFRTVAKRINLKTGSGNPVGSASYDIDGAGWITVTVDDANVANYKFATFSYDSTWDVNVTGRRAFAVWSDAGISFDGRLNITGGTALNTSHKGGAGIAGGYDGGGDQQGDTEVPPWPLVTTDKKNGPGHGNPSNITVVNPGMDPQTSIGGSGAGYGGDGGFYGRYLTGFGGAGGISYGEPQVYTLWGGSGGAGGGSGQSSGGGGGGGAAEFYAKAGNITLGANTQIRVDGGTIDAVSAVLDYPGGGGSGGSVRLVASGNVSVAGLITANGGAGGSNFTADPCDNGGGGGGGRIAVYAGGTFSNAGTITVTGGVKGTDTSGASHAKSGTDGTIYTTGKSSDLAKTYGIAPADGYMGWNASVDPNFQKVSWYPALGSTENTLYFGTSSTFGASAAIYNDANGLRQQKVHSTGALTPNIKYYWRVDYKIGEGTTQTGPVWVFGTGTCTAVNGDLNGDCKVTFVDFALMASRWKVCNLALSSNCNL